MAGPQQQNKRENFSRRRTSFGKSGQAPPSSTNSNPNAPAPSSSSSHTNWNSRSNTSTPTSHTTHTLGGIPNPRTSIPSATGNTGGGGMTSGNGTGGGGGGGGGTGGGNAGGGLPHGHVPLNGFNGPQVAANLNQAWNAVMEKLQDTSIPLSEKPEVYRSGESAWSGRSPATVAWGARRGAMGSGTDFMTNLQGQFQQQQKQQQ